MDVAGRGASLARDAIEEQAGLTEPVEIEEVIRPGRGLAVGRGGPVSAAHGDGGMVPVRESDDEIGIEPSADLDDLDLLSAERVMGMGDGDESRRGLGGGGSVLGAFPTFEDKLLQRAVAMVLEAVYEQDFLDCSYGFRPGRSAHQALEALWQQLMEIGGGWVLEIDIRKFFDTLDHRHLREILRRRVRDGVLLRLIGKWLKAGVHGGRVR